jgi:hypothetical protein
MSPHLWFLCPIPSPWFTRWFRGGGRVGACDGYVILRLPISGWFRCYCGGIGLVAPNCFVRYRWVDCERDLDGTEQYPHAWSLNKNVGIVLEGQQCWLPRLLRWIQSKIWLSRIHESVWPLIHLSGWSFCALLLFVPSCSFGISSVW